MGNGFLSEVRVCLVFNPHPTAWHLLCFLGAVNSRVRLRGFGRPGGGGGAFRSYQASRPDLAPASHIDRASPASDNDLSSQIFEVGVRLCVFFFCALLICVRLRLR